MTHYPGTMRRCVEYKCIKNIIAFLSAQKHAMYTQGKCLVSRRVCVPLGSVAERTIHAHFKTLIACNATS